MRARTAAFVGVVAAILVGALAIVRHNRPVETRAVQTTRAIRIVRRDRMGLPEKKGLVRDPARVRALTEALGVDGHPAGACPADYADADIGIILSGDDVYARRNVYVFGLLDADAPVPDAGSDAESSGAAPAGPSEAARETSGAGGSSGAGVLVVSVTSAGCRLGPPADAAIVKRELRAATVLDGPDAAGPM